MSVDNKVDNMEFPSISIKKQRIPSQEKVSKTTNKPQKCKPKPIVGQCINQKSLRNKLMSKELHDFKIFKTKDPNKSIIIPNSKEVRDATLQILQDDKINFFTYTPEEEKYSTYQRCSFRLRSRRH